MQIEAWHADEFQASDKASVRPALCRNGPAHLRQERVSIQVNQIRALSVCLTRIPKTVSHF
ncbi:hypothetical protein, partial [Brucella inopinata]|uniref:hypothetical protein n=1 Tax=Brucella inopinata TaxID=1218315 RepID=UPI0027407F8A